MTAPQARSGQAALGFLTRGFFQVQPRRWCFRVSHSECQWMGCSSWPEPRGNLRGHPAVRIWAVGALVSLITPSGSAQPFQSFWAIPKASQAFWPEQSSTSLLLRRRFLGMSLDLGMKKNMSSEKGRHGFEPSLCPFHPGDLGGISHLL